MSTVNYSVPEEVRAAFNDTFVGRNKSAIIADLMMRAVEEERLRERRASVMDRILSNRADMPRASDEDIASTRREARP